MLPLISSRQRQSQWTRKKREQCQEIMKNLDPLKIKRANGKIYE